MFVVMGTGGGCSCAAVLLGVWLEGSAHLQKISCNLASASNFTSIGGVGKCVIARVMVLVT